MCMIKQVTSNKFFDQIIALEVANFSKDALGANQLAEIITHEDHALFIACVNEEMIGYIYVNIVRLDKLMNVMKLVVKSDKRKHGIGQKLLEYVERWCKDQGIERIVLEVRISNIPAIMLYEKCGYHRVGIRKQFYQFPQEDALILMKAVPSEMVK